MSFLNTLPLIDGLIGRPDVALQRAVPSALAALLLAGRVDAALLPVVDWARRRDRWDRLGNACIAADGETLTVRVYSRVPPERVTCVAVDPDSHTSVVLARVLWHHWYRRPIEIVALEHGRSNTATPPDQAVLLIGDKVIASPLAGFPHVVDLGAAWKSWTGLPFVFAIWVGPRGVPGPASLTHLLEASRDRGVARAETIARAAAEERGWPADIAAAYLTRYMKYTLTPPAIAGMERFIALAEPMGLLEPQEVSAGPAGREQE